MTAQASRDVLRRFVDELVNRYDLALVDQLFAPDCRFYFVSDREPLDREGYKGLLTMFRTAFPDLQHTAEAVVAEEDAIAERFRVRGTHRGEFQMMVRRDQRGRGIGRALVSDLWRTK